MKKDVRIVLNGFMTDGTLTLTVIIKLNGNNNILFL